MSPIGGVDSSFVEQYVACDVMKQHPDYYPILVLAEILSASEGPLWMEVRGKGLAYDARVELFTWPTFLCFSLHESSAPAQVKIYHWVRRRSMNRQIQSMILY
jgi:Zn-dependent M16 (insulinase) family peptidase